MSTEEVVPPCSWLVLVEPREQLRHGSRAEEATIGATRNGLRR
jgi:hypothetical protein